MIEHANFLLEADLLSSLQGKACFVKARGAVHRGTFVGWYQPYSGTREIVILLEDRAGVNEVSVSSLQDFAKKGRVLRLVFEDGVVLFGEPAVIFRIKPESV